MTRLAEITRDETAERARLLRVRSYDIELDLTGGPETFRSSSVINFDCAEPGAASYADLVAEAVHEITLNGAAVDPATAWRAAGSRWPGLAARTSCGWSPTAPTAPGDRAAPDRSTRPTAGSTPSPSSSRPHAQPGLRQLRAARPQGHVRIHLTAPAHWTVVSNQPAPEPEPAGAEADGVALRADAADLDLPDRDRGRRVPPGARFAHDPRWPGDPAGSGLPAVDAGYLEADDVFGITRQGLDYFTGLFASAYPFDKFDQVFVPDNAGAMENVGCVIISEQLLFRSKVTDTALELRADGHPARDGPSVVRRPGHHEVVGRPVAERVVRRAAGVPGGRRGHQVHRRLDHVLRRPQDLAATVRTSCRPRIRSRPTWRRSSEAEANFDGISYAKGAAVLKQLVAYVGRDSFFAGIRGLLRRARLGERDAGRPARGARGELRPGPGGLVQGLAGDRRARTRCAPSSRSARTARSAFAVVQEAPAEHPDAAAAPPRDRPVRPGRGGALVRTHRVEVDVAGPRTEVPELVGRPQPDLVLLNDDDLDYAIVRFDDAVAGHADRVDRPVR